MRPNGSNLKYKNLPPWVLGFVAHLGSSFIVSPILLLHVMKVSTVPQARAGQHPYPCAFEVRGFFALGVVVLKPTNEHKRIYYTFTWHYQVNLFVLEVLL